VTLVFTDIEGSTRLLEELGVDGYREALAEHRRVVRGACARHAGYEVDYEGDAFFYAFASAQAAVLAVSEAMAGLQTGPIRIRVGVHTGEPELDPPKYVGMDVHLAARVMSSAHGGQVVLSPATVALLEPASRELLDLGEHRLKDIAEPVFLYQLGDGSFPPLKTISNTNLPRPASSFVGRERELPAVLATIEQGVRLLTLTGPGGSGKTRLALEAAAALVPEYKAGVFWVGLASLRDPALVTEAVSQTLGAKDGLAEHIGERELLLLLDNLEQVIEAAPELSELLQDCPNLTLLITSRELLRVQGEVEYAVPPLAEPDAVSLFCERAQTEPSEKIAELCKRLDSLPLAIELAAARAKALSPTQILERLSGRLDLLKGGRDADPRQQTLRATIEWSYDLLSEGEKRLFVRLSVFAGGCTLEAAEEVADADLDTLQSLVEKSLLRFSNERYWMLETIREFGAERLAESSDEEDVVGLHAAYFLKLTESLAPSGYVVDAHAVERLMPEQDNLRAAVGAALARGDVSFVARVVGRVWSLLLSTVYAHEAIQWSRLALERREQLSRRDLESVLVAGGELMRLTGDLDSAESLKLELVELARAGEVSDSWRARTLADLSDIARDRDQLDKARFYAEQSVAEGGGIRAAASLGEVELRAGNLTSAARLLDEAARGFEGVHDFNHAFALEALGEVARREGHTRRATAYFADAARRFARLGDQASVGDCLDGFAALAAAEEDWERAAVLAGAAEQMRSDWGRPALRRERLIDDLPEPYRARGRTMTVDDALEYAVRHVD
jgi:predicted ATPase